MSFMVTGIDPQGRSAYYRRNIGTKAHADVLAKMAEESGWTRVQSTRESF